MIRLHFAGGVSQQGDMLKGSFHRITLSIPEAGETAETPVKRY